MATIRIVLGILCLAFFGQFIEPGGNFLRGKGEDGKVRRWEDGKVANHRQINSTTHQLTNSTIHQLTNSTTTTILRIAQSQIGVREATGKNDGKEIEVYLAYTGNKKGDPWCASFVSWVYGQAGYPLPRTAWSPALFPLARQTLNPVPAAIFGIYFPKLKRIAHCGMVERIRANWIYTIEGNTNLAGSREGDGVYRKLRHRRSIQTFANWLDQPGKELQK